jgi:hypothetical protein
MLLAVFEQPYLVLRFEYLLNRTEVGWENEERRKLTQLDFA